MQPGDPGVELTIPVPLPPVAPESGSTGVDPRPTFQWSASQHTALLTVSCGAAGVAFHVVTTDYMVKLPSLATMGLKELPKNAQCSWHVEIDGSYPTVDDATGQDGMLDDFSWNTSSWVHLGMKRKSGSYTTSARSFFTTAP